MKATWSHTDGGFVEVEKDNYESMTLIIHAVLSVSHYKNTKCFGMSAVTDRILMTWLFFLTVRPYFQGHGC